MSKLAFAIARGNWAIRIEDGLALYPRVQAFLTGDNSAFEFISEGEEPKINASLISATGRRSLDDFMSGDAQVEPESIGILNVHDVIMRDDFCGDAGSITKSNQLKWMDSHPNIKGIVLDVNSPGGQVDGTATLADAIKNASTPITAIVNDGMACSAGYWIASAADKVYVTHEHSEVGSIGVYATLRDYSEYFKEKGIRVEDVYAEQSTEKNKGFKDWKAGDSTAFIDRLTHVADAFINVVKENRKGKLNLSAGDPFKGAVYGAAKATEIGLIDGIKSYDEVLESLLNETLTLKI